MMASAVGGLLLNLDRNLNVAVQWNDAAAVQRALTDGANANCIDRNSNFMYDEETPLTQVCRRGYDSIVHIFVCTGANTRWQNRRGQSTILEACRQGKVSTVQVLINHDKGLLELAESNGWTLLFAAINIRNVDLVQFLILIAARMSMRSLAMIQKDRRHSFKLVNTMDGSSILKSCGCWWALVWTWTSVTVLTNEPHCMSLPRSEKAAEDDKTRRTTHRMW